MDLENLRPVVVPSLCLGRYSFWSNRRFLNPEEYLASSEPHYEYLQLISEAC